MHKAQLEEILKVNFQRLSFGSMAVGNGWAARKSHPYGLGSTILFLYFRFKLLYSTDVLYRDCTGASFWTPTRNRDKRERFVTGSREERRGIGPIWRS